MMEDGGEFAPSTDGIVFTVLEWKVFYSTGVEGTRT